MHILDSNNWRVGYKKKAKLEREYVEEMWGGLEVGE